jgi:hypothetical protein
MFFIINLHALHYIVIGVFVISIIVSLVTGLFMRIICEAFPTRVRLTGVAIAYNVAFAIVGGIAPLSAEFLIRLFGNVEGISIIAIICGICGLIAIPLLSKKRFLN